MKTLLRLCFYYMFKPTVLPKKIDFYRNATTNDMLAHYIKEPESYWKGIKLRHANKVQKAVKMFAEAGIKQPELLSRRLVSHVQNHRNRFYRPFFIMGAGGSGSTWLGALLGDFSTFRYGGEIYIPPSMLYLYQRFKNQQMINLIWSVMILHTWGFNDPKTDFEYEFVNSARSIFSYEIFRQIWPAGRFIYLVRDPRDQILSVTFRKAKYRNELKPSMDDISYLIYNAKKNAKTNHRFKKIKNNSILITRYEDLKKDTFRELKKINKHFKLNEIDKDIYSAVYNNSAENMRTGKVKRRGNLDEGGISQKWKYILTDRQKQLIKPIIKKSLVEFGYDNDKNW